MIIKEKLRLVQLHTVIFMLVIILNITVALIFPMQNIVLYIFTGHAVVTLKEQCRAIESLLIGTSLLVVLDIVIIIFITYMSVKFSQPMKVQWEKFIQKANNANNTEANSDEQSREELTSEDLKVLDVLNE